MGDDRLSHAGDRELFDAIVSRLVDPELALMRRTFLGLCAALYSIGALVVGLAGLGWAGILAYTSTFLASVLVVLVVHRRRFARRCQNVSLS